MVEARADLTGMTQFAVLTKTQNQRAKIVAFAFSKSSDNKFLFVQDFDLEPTPGTAFLVRTPAVFGQDALSVTSSTDGNGLYTYTFSKGSQPYVWGLSTTTAIYLKSYGVLETSQPTNWSAKFDGSGRIVWSVANGIAFLDAPVTVSVRSILHATRAFLHLPINTTPNAENTKTQTRNR